MAAKFFSITAKDPGILLEGQGEVTITVTNVSGRPIRGQVWLNALGETRKEWLTIVGETERDFGVDETHSFTVRIRVPAGTLEGTYTFRPVVASFKRPNEEFDEGQMIAFQLPKVTEQGGFNWWPLIATAAAVVLIGAGAAWWILSSKVELPDVVGMQVADAMTLLVEAGVNPAEVGRELTESAELLPAGITVFPPAPGTVLRMNPPAGQEVEKGSTVELVLEAEAVLVPPLLEKTLQQAVQALQQSGLKLVSLGSVATNRDDLVGKVGRQDPASGARVLSGSDVQLSIYFKRRWNWDSVLTPGDISILENHSTVIRDQALRDLMNRLGEGGPNR